MREWAKEDQNSISNIDAADIIEKAQSLAGFLSSLQMLNFKITPIVPKVLCYQPPVAVLRRSLAA